MRETTNMTSDAVLVQVANGVATVTLNRPGNRNALSTELVAALSEALTLTSNNDAVHLIVLTGEGTVFCAGADLKERRSISVSGSSMPPPFVSVFEQIQQSPKVVLARLNGSALAGGLGLACACDLSIAPESAKFGFTEVRIGVAPAIISVVCLPRMTVSDAAELMLTGERFDARRAAAAGLITKAVPDSELDFAVADMVAKLRLGGPKALAATKDVLRRVPQMADRASAFAEMAVLSGSLFASDEGIEGMTAFAEKRVPKWVEQN
jgi:methylglutaconyl-CoA hydratase